MIADLNSYSAMKDSGVPWLGKVPEHWAVRRIRNIAEMGVSNVDKLVAEGEQSVRLCNYVDVYKHDRIHRNLPFMRATASPAEIARFHLEMGDVLITKDSETWDDIGVPALVESTDVDLISGYHLALLRPSGQQLIGEFLFRALQSKPISYQFHVEANGVTRYGLSHSAIKAISLPLPSRIEQTAIVRFLSYMDRRIRKYIRAKQKLIKLLEEQKQAIIHRAVTGQLDIRIGKPYRAYKPSSVEWLEDVPEHWEVRRLKTLISRVTSGSRGWSNFAANDGPLFIRIGNLTRASIGLNLTEAVRLNLPKAAVAEAERTRVRPGDLLLSITAYIGSVAVVPEEIGEAYISQHVACCRPLRGAANVKWLAYVLLSSIGQTHGKLCMYGGTKQGLSLDDVKNYIVLLPPVAEQDALVSWMENATKSADEAMHSVHRGIALLREYRTRLIADVVTGKVDVREAAARLPEEAEENEELGALDAKDIGEEDEDVEYTNGAEAEVAEE